MNVLPLADFLEVNVATFVLVFLRVSGIFVFGPIVSSPSLPGRFRVYLSMAIAVLVMGTVQAPRVDINNMIDLVVVMVGELLVGFVLGSFLQMIFQSLQLAGQSAGQQLGLSLANVVNPQFDEQTSTTSVIYATVASLAFFGIGAHREMIAALLETFEAIPPAEVFYQDTVRELALGVFQQSMIFAVRVAAPVTVALLFAEITMGFIGRTVPQLNILSVGFSLRILLGLFITMASLGGAMEVFLAEIGEAFQSAYEALAAMAPGAN